MDVRECTGSPQEEKVGQKLRAPRSVWEEEMDNEQNTSVVPNSVAYSETKVEVGGGWSSIMLWTSVVALQHGRCDKVIKVSLLI